jgi:hypothetical protein
MTGTIAISNFFGSDFKKTIQWLPAFLNDVFLIPQGNN